MNNIEDKTHLFFKCNRTRSIQCNILTWHDIRQSLGRWNDELQQMIKATNGNDLAARLLKVSFLVIIYCIWMEHSYKYFQNKSTKILILLVKVCKIVSGMASLYQNFRPFQANVLLATMWRLHISIFSNDQFHLQCQGMPSSFCTHLINTAYICTATTKIHLV